MENLERGMHDKKGYLERMSKAMQEKLRINDSIAENARAILDVGCADGSITRAISQLHPNAFVKGIDLKSDFVGAANAVEHDPALQFEKVYLRELLARPERFDHILFTSVLHEFYSYGEKETSVIKAICDAYELLKPGGKIIIRDMILPERMKEQTIAAEQILAKIRARGDMDSRLRDFEFVHGRINSLYQTDHFLLKYFYVENWERECAENYVPLTREWYDTQFKQMGAQLERKETYLIPYLREKWREDFELQDQLLAELYSTTILSYVKPEGTINQATES